MATAESGVVFEAAALASAESAKMRRGLCTCSRKSRTTVTFEKFNELLQIGDLGAHLNDQILLQFHRVGQLEIKGQR